MDLKFCFLCAVEYKKRSYNTGGREEGERMCDVTKSRQINKGGIRSCFVFFVRGWDVFFSLSNSNGIYHSRS